MLSPPNEIRPEQQTSEARLLPIRAISLHPRVISIMPLEMPNASRESSFSASNNFATNELVNFKNPTE